MTFAPDSVSDPTPENTPDSPQSAATVSHRILRETWLTRKPHPTASAVTIASTFVLAILALVYLTNAVGLASLMHASGDLVFRQHQWWRPWTTIFAHGDPGHLLSNLLLFFVLGYFLNAYFGARMFPFAALIWGGLVNLIAIATYDPEVVLVGASGVVYWMGGVWLVLYFCLSRQKNRTQRGLRTLGVAVLIFMPSATFEANVSHRTHLIGFILGLLAGTLHFAIHRKKFRQAEVYETVFEDVEQPSEPEPTTSLGSHT